MQAVHASQEEEPTKGAKLDPCTQGVQFSEAFGLKVPEGHVRLQGYTAPTWGLNEPGAHSWHVDCVSRGLYVPFGQSPQCEARATLNEPAVQFRHSVEFEFWENVPPSHGSHAEAV